MSSDDTAHPPVLIQILAEGRPVHTFLAGAVNTFEDAETLTLTAERHIFDPFASKASELP